MPVCSYLIHPAPGRAARVIEALERLPHCRAQKAEEHDLIVLVTDTSSLREEEGLRKAVQAMPEVRHCTLTFGEIAPDHPKETAS
jgi:nitrate reductase NapAB chaperone NapD